MRELFGFLRGGLFDFGISLLRGGPLILYRDTVLTRDMVLSRDTIINVEE